MSKNLDSADLNPNNDPRQLLKTLGSLKEYDSAIEPVVVELLNHSDEDVREEAVRCVGVRWRHRPSRNKFAELLSSDPADGVRATAAFALMSVSTDETLIDDTRHLRSVVLNESEDDEVRMAAYESLLLLYQKSTFPQLEGEVSPIREVDWNWIHSLPS